MFGKTLCKNDLLCTIDNTSCQLNNIKNVFQGNFISTDAWKINTFDNKNEYTL